MKHVITLFPIASLLIIAIWLFHGTKPYYKFKAWISKTAARIWDFFTNVCERVNDKYELY